MLPPSLYFLYTLLQLSCQSVHRNVTCDIHVINFTSDKCFGPDDTSQKRMEWNGMRQKKHTLPSPQSMGLQLILTLLCVLVM